MTSEAMKTKLKKPALQYVPPVALIYEALAFADGAAKHGGPYNWRKEGNEPAAMMYVGGLLRHILAWLDGEEVASDSGVPHLGGVRACAAILIDAIELGILIDDRPLVGRAGPLIDDLMTINKFVEDLPKPEDKETITWEGPKVCVPRGNPLNGITGE